MADNYTFGIDYTDPKFNKFHRTNSISNRFNKIIQNSINISVVIDNQV